MNINIAAGGNRWLTSCVFFATVQECVSMDDWIDIRLHLTLLVRHYAIGLLLLLRIALTDSAESRNHQQPVHRHPLQPLNPGQTSFRAAG
jgi:hypothetical protein